MSSTNLGDPAASATSLQRTKEETTLLSPIMVVIAIICTLGVFVGYFAALGAEDRLTVEKVKAVSLVTMTLYVAAAITKYFGW